MKQNQVYKQEIFDGDYEDKVLDDRHQYYLTENKQQDDQAMYAEIHEGSTRSIDPQIRGSIQQQIEASIEKRSEVASEGTVEESTDEGACQSKSQEKTDEEWLYMTVPEDSIHNSVYDEPYQESKAKQEKSEELPHLYDSINVRMFLRNVYRLVCIK